MKIVPPNFDQNFQYCHACLLEHVNFSNQNNYSAVSWLTELFLSSQARAKRLSHFEKVFVATVLTTADVIVQMVQLYFDPEMDDNVLD